LIDRSTVHVKIADCMKFVTS